MAQHAGYLIWAMESIWEVLWGIVIGLKPTDHPNMPIVFAPRPVLPSGAQNGSLGTTQKQKGPRCRSPSRLAVDGF